jgi:YggT family protein
MIEALLISTMSVVIGVLELYKWVIIIHALLSWVNPDPYNQIVQVLNRLVAPSYNLVRKYIPTNFGGIDIAPIIIIFTIVFIETFLSNIF